MRQILIAAAVGLSVTLLGTPIAIRLFRLWGWGQRIREDGPHTHLEKMGTPTMGGIVIIAGIVAGYVATRIVFTTVHRGRARRCCWRRCCSALLGFVDDFIKVRRRRSLGLSKTAKMLGQAVVGPDLRDGGRPGGRGFRPSCRSCAPPGSNSGLLFYLWVLRDPGRLLERREPHRRPRRAGVRLVDPGALGLRLHRVLAVPSPVRRLISERGLLPDRRERRARPRDRRGAPMVGAAAGFLWWNAAPARIFMGDTGSLALGGLLGALALVTSTQLLLVDPRRAVRDRDRCR